MSWPFLVFSFLSVLLLSPHTAIAQPHPACPDESYFTIEGDNGVRYGWYDDATCVFNNTAAAASTHPICPDESHFTSEGDNGVRYGWYNDATCVFDNTAAAHPVCPDDSYFTVEGENGIRYGWFEDSTCVLDQIARPVHPDCPDESYFTTLGDDGINYGWYNDATCIVSSRFEDTEFPEDLNVIDNIENEIDDLENGESFPMITGTLHTGMSIANVPQDTTVVSEVLIVDTATPTPGEFLTYELTVSNIDPSFIADSDNDGIRDYYQLRLYKTLVEGNGSNASAQPIPVPVGRPRAIKELSDGTYTVIFRLNPTTDSNGEYFVGADTIPFLTRTLPTNCAIAQFDIKKEFEDSDNEIVISDPTVAQCSSDLVGAVYSLEISDELDLLNDRVLTAIQELSIFNMTDTLKQDIYIYSVEPAVPDAVDAETYGFFYSTEMAVVFNKRIDDGRSRATVNHEIFHAASYQLEHNNWAEDDWFIEGMAAFFESKTIGDPTTGMDYRDVLSTTTLYNNRDGYSNWMFLSKVVDCLGGDDFVAPLIKAVRGGTGQPIDNINNYLGGDCSFSRIASHYVEGYAREHDPISSEEPPVGDCLVDGKTTYKFDNQSASTPDSPGSLILAGGTVFGPTAEIAIPSSIRTDAINHSIEKITVNLLDGVVAYDPKSDTEYSGQLVSGRQREAVLYDKEETRGGLGPTIPMLYIVNKKEDAAIFTGVEVEITCSPTTVKSRLHYYTQQGGPYWGLYKPHLNAPDAVFNPNGLTLPPPYTEVTNDDRNTLLEDGIIFDTFTGTGFTNYSVVEGENDIKINFNVTMTPKCDLDFDDFPFCEPGTAFRVNSFFSVLNAELYLVGLPYDDWCADINVSNVGVIDSGDRFYGDTLTVLSNSVPAGGLQINGISSANIPTVDGLVSVVKFFVNPDENYLGGTITVSADIVIEPKEAESECLTN